MVRYIIKYSGEWAVVNAEYRGSIRTFQSQDDALIFTSELLDTKVIILQNETRNDKFKKITSWEVQNKKNKKVVIEKEWKPINYIPTYVFKNIDNDAYKKRLFWYLLTLLIFVLIVITITFTSLYIMERVHYA